jgi:hypothetical protein
MHRIGYTVTSRQTGCTLDSRVGLHPTGPSTEIYARVEQPPTLQRGLIQTKQHPSCLWRYSVAYVTFDFATVIHCK